MANIPGGVGKVPVEIVKELVKQPDKSVQGDSFDQVMKKTSPSAGTSEAQGVTPSQAASPTQPVDAATKTQEVAVQKSSEIPKGLKAFADSWNRNNEKLDKIMKAVLSGKDFSPQEGILLQSATYKITTEFQLVTKIAEQAASAAKTTMQTQV